MSAFSGEIANPGTYNDDIRKLVAWGKRESNSTATATEVGVLQLEGIPTKAGRMYGAFTATSMIFNSTVADDLIEARLRYSTTDTATIASTQFGVRAERSRTAAGAQYTDGIIAFLPSPGDGTMSVLLSVARTAGTGNVSISASATYPLTLVILDLGPDTGNIGIAL